MKKNLKLFILIFFLLYSISIVFAVNIYFELEPFQKDDIKNFIIYSINKHKYSTDINDINNITLISIFCILIYVAMVLLASLNKYLQILNISLVIFKGFSFGFVTASFFSIYGPNGIPFFISYILLKELIVLIFLIILILYSITTCNLKDKLLRKEDMQLKMFILLICILLSMGIVLIDRIVAPSACSLIR